MRTIIAGNWKMNNDRGQAAELIKGIVAAEDLPAAVEMIVAPAFPFLVDAVEGVKGSRVHVAAQNCHDEDKGAFTGEVSALMLKSIGVTACIVGHSERRQYFDETDVQIGLKVAALLRAGITPIFCCGEKKEERQSGDHHEVVAKQVNGALGSFNSDQLKRIIVAYEPVWAIGTGLNATPEQAQDMHAHIRSLLQKRGADVAITVPILYGGSCTPENAADLFASPDVNGGLIGGASLKAGSFVELVRIASRVKSAS